MYISQLRNQEHKRPSIVMKATTQPHEMVLNQQMSALDASDDLASAWEDALASVSKESSFKQQALIWYVILLLVVCSVQS